MPKGDSGSTFAGTGGYGGQFPGFGGASAGYTGGYGNPSSVGGGTAGQTYAGRAYANTLNKHNPTLANYSGTTRSVSGPSGSGGVTLAPSRRRNVTAAQQAEIQARIKANKAAAAAQEAAQVAGPFSSTNPVPSKPTPASTGAYHDPNWSRPEGEWGYPSSDIFDGSWPNINDFGNKSLNGQVGTYPGSGGNSTRGGSFGPHFGGRQFGGPVAPGQQYTVGENGPETLQMGAQGGQVIPNNPADRLGGLNPQMMQQWLQLLQQRQQGQPGGTMQQPPMPPMPPMPQRPPMPQPGSGGLPTPGMGGGMQRPQTQGPGGSFRLGDWRNRMGIEGLSRPSPIGGGGAQRPNMGFGGSGLGIPGVMPHLANRGGGGTRMG